MRRALGSAALGLLLAAMAAGAAAPGAPRAAVRGEASYEQNAKIVLSAQDFPWKGAEFTWDVEGTGAVEYEQQGGKLYVWAAPGRYVARLTAISWDDKKLQYAKFGFSVKGAAPKPPDPPGPGPGPVTTLEKAVIDAYSAETAADKAATAKALAGVYRAAAKAVQDTKPATMGAVWKGIEAGAKAAGVSGKIMAVQKAAQAEWKKLPTRSGDKLDDDKRALVVKVFTDIALALEKLEAKKRG